MYLLLLLAQNLPTELQGCPHPQTHWVGVFCGQTPGGLAVSQVKILLNLQTDMGKTIVRRHLANTDAQSVWKELSEHMRTSSKGASEKRRLTQYVTNTVLDDNFKGPTEQFVLHFNEQFRQLDEISEDSEKLPPSVKLTLPQTAVRSINDLRIVETLDEFQSTTYGHGSSTSLSYDTYYDLLINACVRYDKAKKANIGKRRTVYTTNK